MNPDFHLEDVVLLTAGDVQVAGIDEVGVGALAGPVMAAAVILDRQYGWNIGINDSKALSPRERNRLYDEIMKYATVGIGYATPADIDKHGMALARVTALTRAYEELTVFGGLPGLKTVVDDASLSRYRKQLGGDHSIFTDKADTKSLSVAAASIIAKVTRDRYMVGISTTYPNYNFPKHKGYGTPEHYAALERHGPCKIHRKSFNLKRRGGV